MGNEMGNNNVSGLQEEEKARTEEAQGKFLQEDVRADELKDENYTKAEANKKDFHDKQHLNEKEDTKGEDNTYPIGEGKDFHEVVVPFETLLALEEPKEENETTNGNEDHDIKFKPLSGLEIPADSNDIDLGSEDQEFALSDISDFSEKDATNREKTNFDGNLLTTDKHRTTKEMSIGRDSKAGLGEGDLNSDQQEDGHAEQVAEGISIPQSENGHLVSNDMAENMYSCVESENGDQNIATIMDTLLVKAKASEEEFKMLPGEGKFNVSPEEVDICSQNKYNGDQAPLDAWQLPPEAPEAAVDASFQQLEALNSLLKQSAAPLDALNLPPETLEPPLETLESPQEASETQPLDSALPVKTSDSPLEESESSLDALIPPLETLEPPLKTLESPQEASDPQPLDFALPGKTSDSPLEESGSSQDALIPPLETLEPQVETLESPEEASDPLPVDFVLPVKTSNSLLEDSELSLDALIPPLETLEPQVEALESPLEALAPQPLASALLVKASNPSLEASNSPLEASESPSEASEPPIEALKSRLQTYLKASELSLEAPDSSLEASESQLGALPQPSSINSSQEIYEPHDKTILITSELQNGETKLADNQAQSSEKNDQKFDAFDSKASQSEKMSVESDCNNDDRENALNSNIEKDCLLTESDVHSEEPQFAYFNQTLEPCLKEPAAMEGILLLTEESKPIDSEVGSKGNQCDNIQNQFCDQEIKDLKPSCYIAYQSDFLTTETDCKKNEKQSAHEFDSTYGIEDNHQLEDLGVNCNEDRLSFHDKSLKLESNEIADTMSELEAASTESTVTDYKHDEDRPREEIGDKEKESLLENDRDRGDTTGKSMWPNTSKQAQDIPPYFPDSEASKDKNELISCSKSEFFIITESFHASSRDAIVQSILPSPKQEVEQNIQETSVMAETSSSLFNEQIAKGEETVEKLMTESISDNASNHVEFRKSPSFHFDLSIGSKSEESDQTPLLCHGKSAGRSLISRDEAMFQKDNVQTDYNAPRDEAVLVEEKTIRMERSDSERPSAPFLSLLQKEESAEISVTPEKQEKKNAADKKTKKDPWTVIHKTFALTSPRDSNGKRKPKSSIFSTCICCATKIP